AWARRSSSSTSRTTSHPATSRVRSTRSARPAARLAEFVALPDGAVLAFVRATLPPPPARVLEVGAGHGELAAALREAGYDVVAIDPTAHGAPGVEPIPLLDLDAPDASFDAAVAVVSLHHVEPL